MRPGRHCVEGVEWGNYDALYLASSASTPAASCFPAEIAAPIFL
jgi:hypothetical protein